MIVNIGELRLRMVVEFAATTGLVGLASLLYGAK